MAAGALASEVSAGVYSSPRAALGRGFNIFGYSRRASIHGLLTGVWTTDTKGERTRERRVGC